MNGDDDKPLPPMASAALLQRFNPLRPARLPVVSQDLLLMGGRRRDRMKNPFPFYLAPIVAGEVVLFLIAVAALTLVGLGPLWDLRHARKGNAK